MEQTSNLRTEQMDVSEINTSADDEDDDCVINVMSCFLCLVLMLSP